MTPGSRKTGHTLIQDEIEAQGRMDIQAAIHQLKKDIPALIRQAIKEEYNSQLLNCKPSPMRRG